MPRIEHRFPAADAAFVRETLAVAVALFLCAAGGNARAADEPDPAQHLSPEQLRIRTDIPANLPPPRPVPVMPDLLDHHPRPPTIGEAPPEPADSAELPTIAGRDPHKRPAETPARGAVQPP